MIKNIKESKAMLLEEIVVYEVSYAYLDELDRRNGRAKRLSERKLWTFLNRNNVTYEETLGEDGGNDGWKIYFRSKQQFRAFQRWAIANIDTYMEF